MELASRRPTGLERDEDHNRVRSSLVRKLGEKIAVSSDMSTPPRFCDLLPEREKIELSPDRDTIAVKPSRLEESQGRGARTRLKSLFRMNIDAAILLLLTTLLGILVGFRSLLVLRITSSSEVLQLTSKRWHDVLFCFWEDTENLFEHLFESLIARMPSIQISLMYLMFSNVSAHHEVLHYLHRYCPCFCPAIGASPTFEARLYRSLLTHSPVTNPKDFAAFTCVLENVGISAYCGAAQLFVSDTVGLYAAASILAVEARHSAWVNSAEPTRGTLLLMYTPLDPNQAYTIAPGGITSCPSSNMALPAKVFPALSFPVTAQPNQTVQVSFSGNSTSSGEL
ncbi:hypothetical protein SERLA73DRAFT_69095 [Serpula lacrymans var. lacrymans S7.3]|uniref:Uncharacterized protein n=2 Tax=Serpula lacrymans var. lacrymans TaxID=341189 RepID=F8PJ26_SERL3|nr:uncharacterized protein SERLADRAFT_432979 [Serpula lacrymans var. lacrymans S7.9]EGO03187.1 hypothetical protein SERLA73DRAFT_69095 [Serpula lacrymans var. lacrymans S7.3]EGO28965.1 hypothetical protein SERLADRAFT_432979 [Serpula lacrymans var. lacrymans S7.9]